MRVKQRFTVFLEGTSNHVHHSLEHGVKFRAPAIIILNDPQKTSPEKVIALRELRQRLAQNDTKIHQQIDADIEHILQQRTALYKYIETLELNCAEFSTRMKLYHKVVCLLLTSSTYTGTPFDDTNIRMIAVQRLNTLIENTINDIVHKKVEKKLADFFAARKTTLANISVSGIVNLRNTIQKDIEQLFEAYKTNDHNLFCARESRVIAVDIVHEKIMHHTEQVIEDIIETCKTDLGFCVPARQIICTLLMSLHHMFPLTFPAATKEQYKNTFFLRIDNYINEQINHIFQKTIKEYDFLNTTVTPEAIKALYDNCTGKISVFLNDINEPEYLKRVKMTFLDKFYNTLKEHSAGIFASAANHLIDIFFLNKIRVTTSDVCLLKQTVSQKLNQLANALANPNNFFSFIELDTAASHIGKTKIHKHLEDRIAKKAKHMIETQITNGLYFSKEILQSALDNDCGLTQDNMHQEDNVLRTMIQAYMLESFLKDAGEILQQQMRVRSFVTLVLFLVETAQVNPRYETIFSPVLFYDASRAEFHYSRFTVSCAKQYLHAASVKMFLKPYATVAEASRGFAFLKRVVDDYEQSPELQYCQPHAKIKDLPDLSEQHALLLLTAKHEEVRAKDAEHEDSHKAKLIYTLAQLKYRHTVYAVRKHNGHDFTTRVSSFFGKTFSAQTKWVESGKMIHYVERLVENRETMRAHPITSELPASITAKDGTLGDLRKEIVKIAKL